MRIPYQAPGRANAANYSGKRFIQQLLANSQIDDQGLFPVLFSEEHGVRWHLAVPTALSCLGPKVAGLLVFNHRTGHFEPLSLVMDQRITHLASRNRALDAIAATGNAVLSDILDALTTEDATGMRLLGHCQVLHSGFSGFHIKPDPEGHPLRGDLVMALEGAVILRFKVTAPGAPNSVLFRQRTYLVEAGEFFENMDDISVDFHNPSSPLFAMAWSALPHVAIAAHRREQNGFHASC